MSHSPTAHAGVDPLTGLPDRSAALAVIDDALDGSRDVAVLFLDLNGFKAINDTFGHAAGDAVLRQVAQRLRTALPDGDVVGRIGGDEFVAICCDVADQRTAEQRAQSVADSLTDPFEVDGTPCWAGASVGIALPDGHATAADLLWNADVAMYTAKRARTAFALFTPALREQDRKSQQRILDLRQALEKDQFALAYHPLIDAWSGHTIGVEALLRWNHPDGPISPVQFVPLAERLGLIESLGEFALRTALRDFARWRQQDPVFAPEFVSVNVAAAQLRNTAFTETVRSALDEAGVNAQHLTIEVTESALVTDDVSITLADLADLGVRLDVDDFGTGYSSLAYLVRLPVHALKIDRSFVWDLDEDQRLRTTLRAVIRLAHDLGLKTVAEGVERASHVEFLRREGCDILQGFYYSKPVPADEVLGVCASQPMNRA